MARCKLYNGGRKDKVALAGPSAAGRLWRSGPRSLASEVSRGHGPCQVPRSSRSGSRGRSVESNFKRKELSWGCSEAGSGFYSWNDLEHAFKTWPSRIYEELVPYPVIFVQAIKCNKLFFFFFPSLSTLDRRVGEVSVEQHSFIHSNNYFLF